VTLISHAHRADLAEVTLDPTAAIGASLAMAIGWTMVFAGGRKRMLQLKGDRKRRCPSCGCRISGRVCERH
jgi:hypothetical protein